MLNTNFFHQNVKYIFQIIYSIEKTTPSSQKSSLMFIYGFFILFADSLSLVKGHPQEKSFFFFRVRRGGGNLTRPVG